MIELLRRPEIPTVLRAQLSALARKHRVCGAQLAVRRGERMVTVEVGELEHGGGRQVTREAAFPIGSVTKPFTATLAMILVADGDVDLDAPLIEHLPELNDVGKVLSLRQLLSHTAGLACGPDSADLSSPSLRRYTAEHCGWHNMLLTPGSGFSYSNMGYVLTGRLIEAITGMSWSEAMASILLRPLGIEPAFICPTVFGPSVRTISTGHSANAARIQPVRQSLAPAEAPAGALAASAADLVALGRLHVPPGVPGLLPPAYAEQMRWPVPAADPFGLADAWGLGLAVFKGKTSDWVGHDGNADGTSCYLRIDPAEGWIIGLTTNTGTGIGLWQELLGRLADTGIPVTGTEAHVPEGPPAPPPPDCAGTYANGDSEYVVTGADGRFSLTVDGSDFEVLIGGDGLTFAILDRLTGQRLPGGRFHRDPVTRRIDGIQVNGRLATRRLRAATV